MRQPLRYGSRGPDVEEIQKLLNLRLRHGQKLVVDGVFGPMTLAAVRCYQAVIGIGIDGIVGEVTWNALVREQRLLPLPVPAKFPNAPWMTIALTEEGQEEVAGPEHNPRIIQYHATTTLHASTDETSWCSSFVNWCMQQVGITGTRSASARSWTSWGAASAPVTGAITVIHNHDGGSLTASGFHVGFLVQDTGSHYRLLGGNQSNMVKMTFYPKQSWQLVACRWPK